MQWSALGRAMHFMNFNTCTCSGNHNHNHTGQSPLPSHRMPSVFYEFLQISVTPSAETEAGLWMPCRELAKTEFLLHHCVLDLERLSKHSLEGKGNKRTGAPGPWRRNLSSPSWQLGLSQQIIIKRRRSLDPSDLQWGQKLLGVRE